MSRPPLNMIVYCVLANTSVPNLARIVPGLTLVALSMGGVWIACRVFRQWGGDKRQVSRAERRHGAARLLPPLVSFPGLATWLPSLLDGVQ